jgi:hypothetical protein
VNVTPLAMRSLVESIEFRFSLFRDPPPPAYVTVPGARRAVRLDGLTHGDSPAEPQLLIMVLAETADEIVTVSIHTWERGDVRQVAERIAGSLACDRQPEPGSRSGR